MKCSVLVFLIIMFVAQGSIAEEYDSLLKGVLDRVDRSSPAGEDSSVKTEKETPLQNNSHKVPISAGELYQSRSEKLIDIIEAKDKDIKDVLRDLMHKSGLNIVVDAKVTGNITIYLKDIVARDALRIILDVNSFAYSVDNGVVYVMTSSDFEEKYGFPFGQKIQTKIIPLTFADHDVVMAALEQIKSDKGKIIYSEATNNLILIDSPENLLSMRQRITDFNVPSITETINLMYIDAEEAASLLWKEKLIDGESVTVNKIDNNIVVTQTKQEVEKIRRFIKGYDVLDKDIELKIKTIQIILDEEYPKGVDWEAIVSGYAGLEFENGEDVNRNGKLKLGTLSSEDFIVLLDALDTVGAVYSLRENNIGSQEGQTSAISIKSLDMSFLSKEEDNSKGVEGIEEAKYRVAPSLLGKNQFVLKVMPDFFLKRIEYVQREIDVEVEESSTIVIGGLYKAVKVEKKRKIPLLGDLPLLGFAFRSQRERIAVAEIVVFITPQLVDKK